MSEDKKVTVYRFSTLPPLPEPMTDETVITPEDFDLSSKMQIRTLDEIGAEVQPCDYTTTRTTRR